MKQRHKAAIGFNARMVLANINANATQDLDTLRPSQVAELLKAADRAKYRHPKNANGSRARYFFAKLQREARWT